MSSRAGKLKKELQLVEEDTFALKTSTTLVGSIVWTCAMLTESTPKAAEEIFKMLEDNYNAKSGIFSEERDMSIRELTAKVWEIFDPSGDYESMKAYVFLFTDDRGIYTPLVAPVITGRIMPLNKYGLYLGVLLEFTDTATNLAKEVYVQAEPLFKELKKDD